MMSWSKVLRVLAVVSLVVMCARPGWCGDEWQPITPAELSLTSVPEAPGATAVILYREQRSDDKLNTRYEYVRVKILARDGLKWADVEIPVFEPFTGISGLKARTIHPDGSIVEFTGKTYDKTVIKTRDFKIKEKTFTLPDVTVGSIIEYRFYRTLESYGPQHKFTYDTRWDMQSELYTLRAKFWLRQEDTPLRVFGGGTTRLYYVYSHFPANAGGPKQNSDGTMELEMKDLPALEEEEYMPPKDILGTQVRFYYGGDAMKTADEFWKEAGKYWYQDNDEFVKRGSMQEAVNSIVAAGDTPEVKARKIYTMVQSLRNVSWERDRTTQEFKAANIKDNTNVGDVWNHKYGDHRDLNRLYMALARAAGLQVSAVRSTQRRDTIFNKNVMALREMPFEILVLDLDGKEVFLDPGMKYCPFGVLPWYKTATTAIKLDKNGGTFIKTPLPRMSTVKRTGQFMLDPDGTLHGELTIVYQDQTSVTAREQEWGEDDSGRAKDMEDQVKSWLPTGAAVKLMKANTWEGSETPLELHFTIQVPGYASTTGKHTFLPFGLFQGKDEYLFQHAERKYPVYLPYPWQHFDVVEIKLPPGVTVESMPKERADTNDVGRLATVDRVSGDTLHLERLVSLFQFYYPLDQYEQLRGFYGRVKIADDEQIVLTNKPTPAN